MAQAVSASGVDFPAPHKKNSKKTECALLTLFQSHHQTDIILSDDDFEIKSKIYSFNLRLVLKHVFFWNLLFTLLF